MKQNLNIPNDEADIKFMSKALNLAKKSLLSDDVPVGAIVVKNGEIIGRGYNKREKSGLSTSHAEIIALEQACRKLGGWYLHDCTVYVTLEPCPMCAGAIINSRIERVVFGAYDYKSGCFGSLIDFNSLKFNHQCKITGGVLEKECAGLISGFFKEKRKK